MYILRRKAQWHNDWAYSTPTDLSVTAFIISVMPEPYSDQSVVERFHNSSLETIYLMSEK